jgi:hypothetical protein
MCGTIRQGQTTMQEHTGKTGFMIAILADALLHSGGVSLGEAVCVQAWLGAAFYDNVVGQT